MGRAGDVAQVWTRLLAGAVLPSWLLACSGSGPTEAEERAAYLAAVDAGDPAACGAITREELRGECTAQGAREQADAGRAEAAWATCGAMPGGAWRDECHFLVADALALTDDAARRACADAGRYREQCLGHAIAREAAVHFGAVPWGEEARLLVELEAVVGRYIGGGEVQLKARRLLAGELASRELDAPFGEANCGSAPREVCVDAYAERVKRAARLVNAGESDGSWRHACGKEVSLERARALDLPLWEPDQHDVVQDAWRELCAR